MLLIIENIYMQSYTFNNNIYKKQLDSLIENKLTQDILFKIVKKSYNIIGEYNPEEFLKSLSNDNRNTDVELMKQIIKFTGKKVILDIYKQVEEDNIDKIYREQKAIDELFLNIIKYIE